MVDQRVAAEKQNGLGTPYISPMTRPYTCMLSEHKPVRRGREMIDGPDMRVSNLRQSDWGFRRSAAAKYAEALRKAGQPD